MTPLSTVVRYDCAAATAVNCRFASGLCLEAALPPATGCTFGLLGASGWVAATAGRASFALAGAAAADLEPTRGMRC